MSKPVRLTGQIASEGYAEGPIWLASPAAAKAYRRKSSAAAEREALAAAIAAGSAETAGMVAAAEGDAAGILEFQLAMLEDDTFATAANEAIDSGSGADRAWQEVLDADPSFKMNGIVADAPLAHFRRTLAKRIEEERQRLAAA